MSRSFSGVLPTADAHRWWSGTWELLCCWGARAAGKTSRAAREINQNGKANLDKRKTLTGEKRAETHPKMVYGGAPTMARRKCFLVRDYGLEHKPAAPKPNIIRTKNERMKDADKHETETKPSSRGRRERATFRTNISRPHRVNWLFTPPSE